MTRRECPVCGSQVPSPAMFCSPHWRLVPDYLQHEIGDMYLAAKDAQGSSSTNRVRETRAALLAALEDAAGVVRRLLGRINPPAFGLTPPDP